MSSILKYQYAISNSRDILNQAGVGLNVYGVGGAGVVEGVGVTVKDAWSGVMGVIKESQPNFLKGGKGKNCS